MAANHYIRPDAAAPGTGADWSTAWPYLPATLVRGDTYYIASGNYGSYIFRPLAGTDFVYIRKATGDNHGTDAGWDAAYGNGQAVFSGAGVTMDVRMSYLDIDGVTGEGTSGHGIRISSSTTADAGTVRIYNGYTADHLRFRHVEMSGAGAGIGSQSKVFYNSANSYTDHVFEYCFLRDGGQTWLTESTGSGLLVDHCYFKSCGSGNSAYHSAGIVFAGNKNVTIRNSVLQDMYQNGSTTYIEPQIVGDGVYIYGNVFRGTQAWEGCSQGILAITSSDTCKNVFIFNNTIYGLNSQQPGVWGGNVAGSSVYVRNNIWQGNKCLPNFTLCSESSNIKNTGEVSFVDPKNGDFRLTANTRAGEDLGTPYNVDAAGNVRSSGAWSIGAFQYVSGGNVTPPLVDPPTVTNPPSVVIVAPSIGASVNGTTVITANAVDGSSGYGLARVSFYVDDASIGAVDAASSPYSLSWNSGAVASGNHTLKAIALDRKGNQSVPVTIQFSVQNSVNVAPEMLAYLKLDETGGLVANDSSGAGNAAACLNGLGWTAGKLSACASFDGVDDYLRIPTSPTLELTSDQVTIAAWVKSQANGSWQAIARKVLQEGVHSYPYSAYDLIIEDTTGSPRVRMAVSRPDGVREVCYSSSPITYGAWYHLAGVYDGSSISVYVNGVLAGTTPFSGSIARTDQPLLVGRNGIGGDVFKGSMDELKVYSRALSASEVLALARSAPPQPPSNLRVVQK